MCPGKERTLEKWDLKIDEAFYTTAVERGILDKKGMAYTTENGVKVLPIGCLRD